MMQVFRSLEEIPNNFGPTIVSVGNFDGVHRAHRAVLKDIVSIARDKHGTWGSFLVAVDDNRMGTASFADEAMLVDPNRLSLSHSPPAKKCEST